MLHKDAVGRGWAGYEEHNPYTDQRVRSTTEERQRPVPRTCHEGQPMWLRALSHCCFLIQTGTNPCRLRSFLSRTGTESPKLPVPYGHDDLSTWPGKARNTKRLTSDTPSPRFRTWMTLEGGTASPIVGGGWRAGEKRGGGRRREGMAMETLRAARLQSCKGLRRRALSGLHSAGVGEGAAGRGSVAGALPASKEGRLRGALLRTRPGRSKNLEEMPLQGALASNMIIIRTRM